MKPPICAVCGRDFDPAEEGGLVQVGTGREPWWDGIVDPEEVAEHGPPTGHPAGEAWFCGDHVEPARERSPHHGGRSPDDDPSAGDAGTAAGGPDGG